MYDTNRILLKLENISKSFAKVENDQVTHALDQIDLQMESGEFISLVGPSGCGVKAGSRSDPAYTWKSDCKWGRSNGAFT